MCKENYKKEIIVFSFNLACDKCQYYTTADTQIILICFNDFDISHPARELDKYWTVEGHGDVDTYCHLPYFDFVKYSKQQLENKIKGYLIYI